MKKTLSREQLRHLAQLAGLNLDYGEEEKLGVDISGILGYVSDISRLNLRKVPPLTHAVDIKNIMREDKVVNRKIPTPRYFKCKKIL